MKKLLLIFISSLAMANIGPFPGGSGGGGGGSGTVTSVGLSEGSSTPIFNISGSPVTTAGILTETLKNQSANVCFAGPTSGGASQPTFRSLVGADLPNPSSSTLGGVQSAAAVSNQWINSISTSGVPALSQPGFSNLSGNINVSQMNSGTAASSSTFWRGDSTWATPAATAPAGSNTQVQYNNSGSFGANSGFTSDGSGNVTVLSSLTGNGTAGAPSHSFSGRATNGMYSSAANTIDFSTNGVDKWQIPSSGDLIPVADKTYNIGNSSNRVLNIGTAEIDIFQASNAANYATFSPSSSSTMAFYMRGGTMNTLAIEGIGNNDGTYIFMADNSTDNSWYQGIVGSNGFDGSAKGDYIFEGSTSPGNFTIKNGATKLLNISNVGGTALGGSASATKQNNTLAVEPPADVNITGTTTANTATSITITSGKALSQLSVGDEISLSSAATTFAFVTAITSDTAITVATALGNGTSQTVKRRGSIAGFYDRSANRTLIADPNGALNFVPITAPSILMPTGASIFFDAGVTQLKIIQGPSYANVRVGGLLASYVYNSSGTTTIDVDNQNLLTSGVTKGSWDANGFNSPHLAGVQGSFTSFTPQTNAGAGATASCNSSDCVDNAGQFSVTTGVGFNSGNLVLMTFVTAWSKPPVCIVQYADSGSAGSLDTIFAYTNTTSMVVGLQGVSFSLGTYNFNYVCMGANGT